jgi:hypothetical protein
MAFGSTQPLTEMSTRNLPAGKVRPERKADNLTTICEPIVYKCGSLDVSQPYGPPWLYFYLPLNDAVNHMTIQDIKDSVSGIYTYHSRKSFINRAGVLIACNLFRNEPRKNAAFITEVKHEVLQVVIGVLKMRAERRKYPFYF